MTKNTTCIRVEKETKDRLDNSIVNTSKMSYDQLLNKLIDLAETKGAKK